MGLFITDSGTTIREMEGEGKSIPMDPSIKGIGKMTSLMAKVGELLRMARFMRENGI